MGDDWRVDPATGCILGILLGLAVWLLVIGVAVYALHVRLP